jgi:hypothetical protein
MVQKISLTNTNLLNKFEAGYVCFIDESGDEGFKFGKGSSEWFIISGLVIRKKELIVLETVLADIKQKLHWAEEKHLHWNKLHHLERNLLCENILTLPFQSVSVAIHKPSIIEPENFSERYGLYYYTCRHLLEHLSWLVKDMQRIQPEENHKLLTIFSNRAGMSYDELRNYLNILQTKTNLEYIRIDWNFLDKNLVKAYRPNQLAGLQFADAVAGATYNALETINQKEQKKDYLLNIKPKLYAHKGAYWGYGLKILPKEKLAQIETTAKKNYVWLKENFKK